MGRMGKFDIRGMKELQKQLNKLQPPDAFMEDCAKELAARLLRLVIKRTPVGEYPEEVTFIADIPAKEVKFTTKSGKEVKFNTKARKKEVKFTPHKGKKGGTLKRGWTANKKSSAKGYADSLKVHHFGDTYKIEIVNPVEYASYVEYGHRTANHKGWVRGHFMMTISENELQSIAPKVLEAKVKKYLEEFQ